MIQSILLMQQFCLVGADYIYKYNHINLSLWRCACENKLQTFYLCNNFTWQALFTFRHTFQCTTITQFRHGIFEWRWTNSPRIMKTPFRGNAFRIPGSLNQSIASPDKWSITRVLMFYALLDLQRHEQRFGLPVIWYDVMLMRSHHYGH